MSVKMRQGLRKKFIYGVIALVLFVGTAALFRLWRHQEKDVYDVVLLGDSILGQVRDETSVAALLSEKLGKSVYNGAFGGTNMAKMEADRSMSPKKGMLSMGELALAIGYDDFGVQQTLRIRENGTDYFAQTVDELEQIDFSQVKLLVIQHGMNDYLDGVELYNEEDPYDNYSFTGALRTALKTLTKRYPDMRIILATPTYCWKLDVEQTCEEWDAGAGVLEDYVAAEWYVAKEFGVEVVDLYHDFYTHDAWEDWQINTLDGVHPNEAGRNMIAQRLADYCLEAEK